MVYNQSTNQLRFIKKRRFGLFCIIKAWFAPYDRCILFSHFCKNEKIVLEFAKNI